MIINLEEYSLFFAVIIYMCKHDNFISMNVYLFNHEQKCFRLPLIFLDYKRTSTYKRDNTAPINFFI